MTVASWFCFVIVFIRLPVPLRKFLVCSFVTEPHKMFPVRVQLPVILRCLAVGFIAVDFRRVLH